MIWRNNVCLHYLFMLKLLNWEKILNGVGRILNKLSSIEDWCKLLKKLNKLKIFLRIVVNNNLILSTLNLFSRDRWFVKILESVSCYLSYFHTWRKISWINMKKLMKVKKVLDIFSIKILTHGVNFGNSTMLSMKSSLN